MPGDAAEGVGAGVVYFADHPAAFAFLRRRDARPQRVARPVGRVLHSQRLKDFLPREPLQRPRACGADELPQHDVAHIRVYELRPRRRLGLEVEHGGQRRLRAALVVGHRVVGNQAAAVEQELFDSDRLFAAGGEQRKVFGDGVGHAQLPALGQDHN